MAIGRPSLSIIIPTWNEEMWLPRLLRSIAPLKKDVAEVIIADNSSADRTIQIAEQHGCKIVDGGRPAKARNNGSIIARGDILVFIDADAIINGDVLKYVQEHLSTPEVVAVHFPTHPISQSLFIALCYKVMDQYFRTLSYIDLAQGVGSFMAIRRDAFNYLSGFREDLEVGEDLDMFRRLNAIGRVRYEKRVAVFVSPRRFTIENPLSFALKCPVWALLRLLGSKSSLFPYKWIRYSAFACEREEQVVERLLALASAESL